MPSKKKRCTYQMIALLSDTRIGWFRVAREIQDNWRTTTPDTHRSFSDTNSCAYTASPYQEVQYYLLNAEVEHKRIFWGTYAYAMQ